MRKFSVFILFFMVSLSVGASPKNNLKTKWSKNVTPENVWQSYPRPQLQRASWTNLNGMWQYGITPIETAKEDVSFQGDILVPFCVESLLSGVQHSLLPTEKLWYKRTFSYQKEWKKKDVLLHFGAVDYECTVWVNGKKVGTHKGGNNSFVFNITKHLLKNRTQTIVLAVTDPTDKASASRGKQQLDPKGIWYTPVSGIWKTVWIEPVNKTRIDRIIPSADIHSKEINLKLDTSNLKGNEHLLIHVFDNNSLIKSVRRDISDVVTFTLPSGELWTPDNPKLYQLSVELKRKKISLDKVKSYFAIRKVSIQKDECGYKRICLNEEPIFQFGTLDQGWWPDGLLTPPNEKAMLSDMVKTKNMGFNTIRKHIKVEPELFYYYADSLGIMVWQDMVSGFTSSNRKEKISPKGDDWDAPQQHKKQWESELFKMIDQLRFYPSITTWVVFNEGWGQYDTHRVVNQVKKYDSSRITDGVSGWTDRGVGDLYDVHNYPSATMILPENNGDRVSTLGEFGGFSLTVDGHIWNPNMKNWGYEKSDSKVDFMSNYMRVIYDLKTLIAQGLSAAIYTQITDVEGEVNGLLTYDRAICKIPIQDLHLLNSSLYDIPSSLATTLVKDEWKVLSKEQYVEKTYEFNVDTKFSHLSAWLDLKGDVQIWLNNKLVFKNFVRDTRDGNQYNLSEYSSFLIKGKNELKLKVQQRKKSDSFFMLRAF